MLHILRRLLWIVSLSACATPEAKESVGELSLSLSARAGGETYTLSQADFTLKGPLEQQFKADGQDTIVLTLPIGSYTLQLEDGWVLSRVDADGMTPVVATLDSANPAPLVIGPGATTQAMLRFSLASDPPPSLTMGTLNIEVSVEHDDTGNLAPETCSEGLVVNEIDYEQIGSDDAEFIEILNTASCNVSLANVVLELVNGGDGKVYGRCALSAAGELLPSGGRLVIGQPTVLATLPEDVLRMPLSSGGLQNGAADAVRLVEDGRVLDAISYEGQVTDAAEGTGTGSDDGEGAFSRCPDGFDQDDNAQDFRLVPPSAGLVNACPGPVDTDRVDGGG